MFGLVDYFIRADSILIELVIMTSWIAPVPSINQGCLLCRTLHLRQVGWHHRLSMGMTLGNPFVMTRVPASLDMSIHSVYSKAESMDNTYRYQSTYTVHPNQPTSSIRYKKPSYATKRLSS